MPGIIQDTPFQTITIKELHPTFGAEIIGVNFPDPDEQQYGEVLAALAKYGFCVFRNTGMNDGAHVAFSRHFGDLDDIRPYMTGGRKPRYDFYELFDASNLDQENNILDLDCQRSQYNKGNGLFHVDSSFNPRRASFSMLRAVELPPPGTGGNTDFADSRTAFDELPEFLKTELLENDYVAAHSLAHSRKTASPEYFKDLNPLDSKMHLHKLVQKHEPSDRTNLYIAAHAHHIEDVDAGKSEELLRTLMDHVTQKKYTVTVPWENPSDLVIWDNTCVLHRAAGGEFEGKYRRDLRRTTVHDNSPTAWGFNEQKDSRQGFEQGSVDAVSYHKK